jgi:hypothetical protein
MSKPKNNIEQSYNQPFDDSDDELIWPKSNWFNLSNTKQLGLEKFIRPIQDFLSNLLTGIIAALASTILGNNLLSNIFGMLQGVFANTAQRDYSGKTSPNPARGYEQEGVNDNRDTQPSAPPPYSDEFHKKSAQKTLETDQSNSWAARVSRPGSITHEQASFAERVTVSDMSPLSP